MLLTGAMQMTWTTVAVASYYRCWNMTFFFFFTHTTIRMGRLFNHVPEINFGSVCDCKSVQPTSSSVKSLQEPLIVGTVPECFTGIEYRRTVCWIQLNPVQWDTWSCYKCQWCTLPQTIMNCPLVKLSAQNTLTCKSNGTWKQRLPSLCHPKFIQ